MSRRRHGRRLRHAHPGLEGERTVSYAKVERLGAAPGRGRWLLPLSATLGVHAALTGLAIVGDQEHRAPPVRETAQVTLERLPPPAPDSKPPIHPLQSRRLPPPAAARAGRAVTVAPDPSQPLDLTRFEMPVGKSESYAGGFTASSGTSTAAVNDPRARAHGVAGGQGEGSRARLPAPIRRDWACAWPAEEATSDLHDARVTIRVAVGVDGRADRVEVLDSPTPQFAAAARSCARAESFRTARDDAGREVVDTTAPFVVHFLR
jgi:outer membrane biosynthesis protein TonB